MQTNRAASQTWTLTKPQVVSDGGIVVAQNAEAARAGARVLAQGGTAMDAAVVTACVLSVVEPWLSGFGGGGFLVHGAADGTVETLDFNLVAGQGVDQASYPLAGGAGGDWFNWPAVEQDRNLIGPASICVPGAIEGFLPPPSSAHWQPGSWAGTALAPGHSTLAERGHAAHRLAFAELVCHSYRPESCRATAEAARAVSSRIRRTAWRRPTARRVPCCPCRKKAAMLPHGLAEAGPPRFLRMASSRRPLSADLAQMGAPVTAADLAALPARHGALRATSPHLP